MIYRLTIKPDTKEEIKVGKHKLLLNHALFFETDKDLEKEYSKDPVIAVKPIDYELPEFDLYGKKIVIHSL